MLPICSPDRPLRSGRGRRRGALGRVSRRRDRPLRRRAHPGGDGALPRAREPVQDPRRAPDLRQPRARVRRADAARALVLHEAADDPERASPAGADGEGRALPQLRGRARGDRGRADEGRADRAGARLRRRLHLRQRHRHARLPSRRPRRHAAGEGPRRLPPARAGARAGGGVRPHRLHAAHVPQRRGRAGSDGRRPAVHGRLPARRPVPADHARAG